MQDFDCTTSYYDTPEAPADTVQASQQPSPDACENPSNAWLYRTASYVSAVFSPLLTPTYCMMVALWATPLNVLPEGTWLSSAAVVLGLTCFVPLAVLIALVRLGKIADTRVRSRRQRYMLYPVAVVCYCIVGMIMGNAHAPGWLSGFFLGASLATLVAFAVNFFWKISAHATAVGGLFAVLFYIAAAGLNEYYFMPWLTAGALIAGLTGTARLILGAHTLLQVAAGYALGFSAVLLLMWI